MPSQPSSPVDSIHQSNGSDCSSHNSTAHSYNSTSYYNHEPFETFKLKVIQLCCEIGYGEPTEVLHMKGGSYNRIVWLKFASHQSDYILRIPRDGIEEDFSAEIKDQVALLHYLAKLQSVPVASIVAFDSTQDNAIASAYILQTKIPGNTMGDYYYALPISQRLQIATQVAELIIKMESISFNKLGRLIANQALPSRSSIPLSSENFIEVTKYDLHKRQEKTTKTVSPEFKRQSLPSLLKAMLEHQRDYAASNEHRKWEAPSLNRLITFVDQMDDAGLFRTTDDDEVSIFHWDFAARNIMINRTTSPCFCQYRVQVSLAESACNSSQHSINITLEDGVSGSKHHVKISTDGIPDDNFSHTFFVEDKDVDWEVSGVLDWDQVESFPRILTRQPPLWLWCQEPEIDRTSRRENGGGNDIPHNRDLAPDELLIKAHYDQTMARLSPTYMEDAYGRGVWIRMIARFAMEDMNWQACFAVLDKLEKTWPEYYALIRPYATLNSEAFDDNSSLASEPADESGNGDSEDKESGDEA